MLTNEHLEALATVHLHPQTQAGGEVDLMPLLRAVEASAEAAERERCARISETPVYGEQDDITMAAKDRIAAAIRRA